MVSYFYCRYKRSWVPRWQHSSSLLFYIIIIKGQRTKRMGLLGLKWNKNNILRCEQKGIRNDTCAPSNTKSPGTVSKGHSSSTIYSDFTVIIHRTSTTHSLINTIRDITYSCDDLAAYANKLTQIRVADRIWGQDISTGYGGRRNVGTTHGFPWVAVITFRSNSLQKNSGSYQKLRQHWDFMRVRDEEAWC